MSKRYIAVLCLGVLSAPCWSQTAGVANAETDPHAPLVQGNVAEIAPEKILVVGQRPGPGLWKISKDDHVLWVFGTYSPLPKKMEWRSRQVETILSQSQEYLLPPSVTVHVGLFKQLTLLPHVISIAKSPDGAQLRDVLPGDVYGRWLLLKGKYIGDDEGIERERPIFVAQQLFQKGMDQAGLTTSREVGKTIEQIVKTNKIKTTRPQVKVAIDDPARALKDFKKSPLDDVACFSRTIESLETDIDAMRIRANAWARGDLEGIQKLSYADREEACGAAMESAMAKAQPAILAAKARAHEAWVAAAEKSLSTNASTSATLPLKHILDPKGLVAALRTKGYRVEAPE